MEKLKMFLVGLLSSLLLVGGLVYAIPYDVDTPVINVETGLPLDVEGILSATNNVDDENYAIIYRDPVTSETIIESTGSYVGAEEIDDAIAPCVVFKRVRGQYYLVNKCPSCRRAHLRHHPSGQRKVVRLERHQAIPWPAGNPRDYWKITGDTVC